MSNVDGTKATSDHTELRGKVVVAKATLRAPHSGRECVYWAVRDRWADEPKEQDVVDFWLEDAQGKVLVLGAHARVDAHAERSRRVVEAVEADLEALGERLAEIKQHLRAVQGPEAAKLQRERKELAQLATFLHATKAHARGRIHVGKSKREQEKWLDANAHVAKVDGFGTRTAKLTRDAWEVVLEPGHEIMINGRCTVELLPPEHGGDGGYREVSSGRVLRGTASSPLLITGVGTISPTREEPPKSPRGDSDARGREGRFGKQAAREEARKAGVLAAIVMIVIVALAVAVGLMLPR